MNRKQIKQRSDYTHKYNTSLGRHGWLRLTPAYSVKIVEDLLKSSQGSIRILDPFSGTSTTSLCAAYLGYPATSVEINPFLVWLGQVKNDIYPNTVIKSTSENAKIILNNILNNECISIDPPPIHNIYRWWDKNNVNFLCRLVGSINDIYPDPTPSKNLLLITTCRLLIALSNASFNHQSLSFKNSKGPKEIYNIEHLSNSFMKELLFVLDSAAKNPKIKNEVVLGDSKRVCDMVSGKFDMVITSPPYPNRISYIRELRPYMYWLGYLNKAREAGELDWNTIGGTWGIATSRLSEWQQSGNSFIPNYLTDILSKISHSDNKNGVLLANYICKYFEDVWGHLTSLKRVLSAGCNVHYIIGNSTFYGILLPTEIIYSDMFKELGFEDVRVNMIRKRNSKKELYEYDVSASII